MAEKSPIIKALEENTKSIKNLHKGLKDNTSSVEKSTATGGGGDATGADKIKDPLTMGGAAKDVIGGRVKSVKQTIGGKVSAASDFMRGGFMRKIPSFGMGGMAADILQTRRESIKKNKEQLKDKQTEEANAEEKKKNKARMISDMKKEDPSLTTADALKKLNEGEAGGEVEPQSLLLEEIKDILIEGFGLKSPGYLELLWNDRTKEDKLAKREDVLSKKIRGTGKWASTEERAMKEGGAGGGIGTELLGNLGAIGVSSMAGFLARTMLPAISGIASLLGPVLLPIIGIIAAAAGGYMVGKMIFDNWVSPWMDEQQKKYDDARNEEWAQETKATLIKGTGEEAFDIETAEGGRKTVGRAEAVEHAGGTEEAFEAAIESGAITARTHKVQASTGDVVQGVAEIDLKSEERRKEALKKSESIRSGKVESDPETKATHEEKFAVIVALNDLYKEQINMLKSIKNYDPDGDEIQQKDNYWAAATNYKARIARIWGDKRISEDSKSIIEGMVDTSIFATDDWQSMIHLYDLDSLKADPEYVKQYGTSNYDTNLFPWWNKVDTGQVETFRTPLSFRRGGGIGKFGGGTEAMLHGNEVIFNLSDLAAGKGMNFLHPVNRALMTTLASNASGKMAGDVGAGASQQPITVVNNNTSMNQGGNTTISAGMAQNNPEPTAQNAELGLLR